MQPPPTSAMSGIESAVLGAFPLPMPVRSHPCPGLPDPQVMAYLFNGYWEDIGTIESFFNANLALTHNVSSGGRAWPHLGQWGAPRRTPAGRSCASKGQKKRSCLECLAQLARPARMSPCVTRLPAPRPPSCSPPTSSSTTPRAPSTPAPASCPPPRCAGQGCSELACPPAPCHPASPCCPTCQPCGRRRSHRFPTCSCPHTLSPFPHPTPLPRR